MVVAFGLYLDISGRVKNMRSSMQLDMLLNVRKKTKQ